MNSRFSLTKHAAGSGGTCRGLSQQIGFTLLTMVLATFAPTILAMPTISYSHGDPTDLEQYMLELINRARANPTEEGIRLDTEDTQYTQYARQQHPEYFANLRQEFASYPAAQPLAFNSQLIQAARLHSQDMVERDYFSHETLEGLSPWDRMQAQGYQGSGIGENIDGGGASNAEDIFWSHWGFMVDCFNISGGYHNIGHRLNILNTGSNEVGLGNFTNFETNGHITQDFGVASSRIFLVGVVYQDQNGNKFYDPGEGVSGVTVMPSEGEYYAVTSSSGGYAIPFDALETRDVGAIPTQVPANSTWEQVSPVAEAFHQEYQANTANQATLNLSVTLSGGQLSNPLTKTISMEKPILVKYQIREDVGGTYWPQEFMLGGNTKLDFNTLNTASSVPPETPSATTTNGTVDTVDTPITIQPTSGFSVGNVTISNIQLSPGSPASLEIGQDVEISFDLTVQSSSTCTSIWIKPLSNETVTGWSYGSYCEYSGRIISGFHLTNSENGVIGSGAIDALQFSMTDGESKDSYYYTIPINYTYTIEGNISNLPTLDQTFSGGIAINGQSSQQSATLNLADAVEVAGDIAVNLTDIGKLADIVVYAEATIPPSNEVMYFMLGEGLTISLWDRNPAHLVAFQPNVMLDAMQSVLMYSGHFIYPGTLKIFFGYRLADGTLIQNTQPIDIAINEDTPTPPVGDNSSVDIAGFLSSHNAWRQQVGVPDLIWSDQMAQLAQDWANQLQNQNCAFEHRPNNGYGENIYGASGFTPTAPDVVDSWGGEIIDYDYATNTCAPGQMCGHYTQIVWQDTQAVGCGTASCEDGSVLWVCNYDPPGNYIGERPY